MAENIHDEEAIFLAALQRATPEERDAYVDVACAGRPELRRRVVELLKSHEESLGPFDIRLPGVARTIDMPGESPIGEKPGAVIGPYKLLQQIGEGGMGVVYMAEQLAPVRRKLALKIIKPGMDTHEVIARFEAERQALALMDHPNIARVFDAGATEAGRPYFVMELVRGVPITDYCDQNNLPVHERLELFVTICHAVQHAHQKGIIHRDIKPTNVLVTMHDGRPIPKVIDFGVAKAIGQQLTDKTLFTQFAQMVGTPLYMSPEQAQLTGQDVDTRGDIYSLGVLLYELLTGTTPFERWRLKQAALDEIRRMIREEDPPSPSTRLSSTAGETQTAVAAHRRVDPKGLSRLVRGDLDWIVMKALEKDRNRRYEAASAFSADVQRYLSDEAVQACPPSAWYRFRKFARRNKAALATACIVGLAMVVTVVVLATSTFLIARHQLATENALQAETRAKDHLRRDSYFHRIALAHRDLSANNLRGALEILGDCPEDLRQWEWRYLMRLCRMEPVILRDKTEINSLAFSPDGERLASAGADGDVKVWSTRTGKVIQTLNVCTDTVYGVAFHPDGEQLASTGADRRVKVWDLTTAREVFSGPCDPGSSAGTAHAVAFSPDGGRLAAGSDGTVNVWDWRNRQLVRTFSGHEKHAICVAFSRDGRHLASGDWRGSVKLWEAADEPLCTFPRSHEARHPVGALAFDSDGGRLATASFDRRVDVWDTTNGELLHVLPHTGLALCVAFSPDGRRLVSTGEDKTVRVWDATTGREVLGLRGHASWCGCVAFSPDGHRLASASMDRTIRIWDATPLQGHEGQEIRTFTQHANEVWSVAVSPDGQRIVSAGFGTPAKVWDAQTGRLSVEFNGHRDIVFCLVWHPEGQRIASAGRDGELFSVKVWDAQTSRENFTLPGVPGGPEFFAVAFSPDSRHLVTGGRQRVVQVWDAKTGRQISALGNHDREIRGVVFSSDGRHLASASGDGTVKLWDATRLDEKQDARHTLRARVPTMCLNVGFSRDGRRLAMGGDENTVMIIDVQTGQLLQILRGHTGEVCSVAFSHDEASRWIASAGEDSTVKVWDSRTGGAPVRSFRGHTGLVNSVAFSPNGRSLVSGSRDHTVKVWDVTQLEEVPDR